eukprot:556920-Rhodomonas_salina.2
MSGTGIAGSTGGVSGTGIADGGAVSAYAGARWCPHVGGAEEGEGGGREKEKVSSRLCRFRCAVCGTEIGYGATFSVCGMRRAVLREGGVRCARWGSV